MPKNALFLLKNRKWPSASPGPQFAPLFYDEFRATHLMYMQYPKNNELGCILK